MFHLSYLKCEDTSLFMFTSSDILKTKDKKVALNERNRDIKHQGVKVGVIEIHWQAGVIVGDQTWGNG